MSSNTITICGGLGADPQLRFTASGQATSTFGVAVSHRWQNKQTNEWIDETSWFNVVTFRELAENCAESLRKGSRVIVTGRMAQRSWTTPEGEKRTAVELVADEIGASLRFATAQVQRNERQDRSASSPPRAEVPDYDQSPF